MQITLKLYATLSEYLPEGSEKHRTVLDIADEETAYGVIERYHVDLTAPIRTKKRAQRS